MTTANARRGHSLAWRAGTAGLVVILAGCTTAHDPARDAMQQARAGACPALAGLGIAAGEIGLAPLRDAAPGQPHPLAQGFATFGTDSGHDAAAACTAARCRSTAKASVAG